MCSYGVASLSITEPKARSIPKLPQVFLLTCSYMSPLKVFASNSSVVLNVIVTQMMIFLIANVSKVITMMMVVLVLSVLTSALYAHQLHYALIVWKTHILQMASVSANLTFFY